MSHPLVDQLRFTRSEFKRALVGVSDEDARRRFEPINCISWIVGHMAAQEQRYWLTFAQKQTPIPELLAFGYGQPASTPPLDEVWRLWHALVKATDPYLDTLTTPLLLTFVTRSNGQLMDENLGSMIRRATYHYWYHTGESQAIRQLIGHAALPEFVGDYAPDAHYRPEQSPTTE